jgi:GNAT superfamily N-acetyltransferase
MISHDENVRALLEAWKLMTGRLPGATFDQSAGLASAFSNTPLAFLNMSLPDRPTPDDDSLRALLSLAKTRAARCPHDSLLALCEPWVPANWETLAQAVGFTPIMNLTGMEAEDLLPPRRPEPHLEFRQVTSDATARDLAVINAHAYLMPPELFECMFNLDIWQADSVGIVGYEHGRPVTCAATFPAAGTIYVALVATMPDAHGKGYAEAAMRRAIAEGRRLNGITRATLHASDMGRPLYASMGFSSGARWALLAAQH